MPLRSSATDEQIIARFRNLDVEWMHDDSPDSVADAVNQVARELASAVSAEKDADHSEVLILYNGATHRIDDLEKEVDEKDAEIARLRIDAERWRTVRPWFSIEENDGGDIQLFCEPELLLSLNERCAPEGELLPQAEWPTVEEIVDEIYPPADSAREAK